MVCSMRESSVNLINRFSTCELLGTEAIAGGSVAADAELVLRVHKKVGGAPLTTTTVI
jgi:hypothetical protein